MNENLKATRALEFRIFCQKNRHIEGNPHYFDEFFFIREILIQNRILNINEKQAH